MLKPNWKLACRIFNCNVHLNRIIDRINLNMSEMNMKAKTLGLEGSFDLDAPYNVFMRNECQKIADDYVAEKGLNCSFKITKDFFWTVE